MNFRTPFTKCEDEGVGFANSPSLTHQEYKNDCDVNEMVRRALLGDMSVFRKPVYLDTRDLSDDSHEIANKIAYAQTVWNDLPENIRQTFGSIESLSQYLASHDVSDSSVDDKTASENNDKPFVNDGETAEPSTVKSTPNNT